MDDQNHSSASMAAAIDSPSGESSRENAKQDINAALSNIDNKMGKLTDLLLRVFEQNEPSVQPVEGERPTGSERQVEPNVEPLQGERPRGRKQQDKYNESFQGERPTGRKRQSESDVEPSQGKRPMGRHKTSVVSESESDSDTCSSRGKRPRRAQTGDDISIYVGDSAGEEADLNELAAISSKDDKKGETQSGGNAKLLDDLAKSLSDEDESTSPNVEPKLADITMQRWGKKLNPEKLKSISDKYNRPANCTSVTGIKCNPEIWSQLSSTKKRTDLHLSNIQQTVLKATAATLQTTNALVTSKSVDGHSQLLAQSVDTIALLAHAHTQLFQLKRD